MIYLILYVGRWQPTSKSYLFAKRMSVGSLKHVQFRFAIHGIECPQHPVTVARSVRLARMRLCPDCSRAVV